MIEMISGHLGSGNWKGQQQDGQFYMSHRLPFSPRSEFRIGADEVLDVQVEAIKGSIRQIKITLTDERLCSAKANEKDFENLLKMVELDTPAPEPIDNQQAWVKGLILFFIACFIFELLK